MESYLKELWILIGAIALMIEFAKIPGIGFLFFGLGSFTFAGLIYLSPELANYQFIIIAFASFSWFFILYWPLKSLTKKGAGSNKVNYFDLVGSEVKLLDDVLEVGKQGRVSWSGTNMNARLDESDKESAKLGDKLYITAVRGNILICSKEQSKITKKL